MQLVHRTREEPGTLSVAFSVVLSLALSDETRKTQERRRTPAELVRWLAREQGAAAEGLVVWVITQPTRYVFRVPYPRAMCHVLSASSVRRQLEKHRTAQPAVADVARVSVSSQTRPPVDSDVHN